MPAAFGYSQFTDGANYNNSDPRTLVTPSPPSNLKVKLLDDNVTFRVSVTTLPYSLFNARQIALSETIRFYFTPSTSVDPASLVTPTAIKSAFAKAVLLDELKAPQTGGETAKGYNGGELGPGVFWATTVNPAAYGKLESQPAGPAFLDQDALSRLVNSIVPGDCAFTIGAPPIISAVFPSPASSLLYVDVTVFFAAPSPVGSFVGVIPYLQHYFSNFSLLGFPDLIEGPFFPFSKMQFDPLVGYDISWTNLQADYNSAGFGDFLTPHNVKIYLVSVSQGRTRPMPITSRPSWTFANGIGF